MTSARPESCLSTITLSAEHLAQLEARLQRRLGGLVREVRVSLRDDGLVLQGRSRTQHARQIAQQLLMDATEVPILANEIRV